MAAYDHTQRGTPMLFMIVFVLATFALVISQAPFDAAMLGFMLAILIIISSFSSLRVIIDDATITLRFGWGLIKKRFSLQDIQEAHARKHEWWRGWGIRWWAGTWTYNVSGYDVVELTMKNGKRVRIGTDEPDQLEQAIRSAIKKQ